MKALFQKEHANSITRRRETVFLLLAGIFLGSLVMLNILGISKFIDLSFSLGSVEVPFVLAVGVLPYPITFLCTDFISELYGKKRANLVVFVGLLLNLWLLLVMWLGGALPPVPTQEMLSEGQSFNGEIFYKVKNLTFSATFASMIAYLSAQFIDVHIFHYLKNKTKGKHLWIRNNGSTMISQLVDSSAVILITYLYSKDALPLSEDQDTFSQLLQLIFSGYIFKFSMAFLDTLPFIFGTRFLRKYLDFQEE
ncbi:MAG: queuosine precursor transporter [Flavobacteriales bacterium]|nr:queuosine precursor transporter [Flavobacteriales bacterium]